MSRGGGLAVRYDQKFKTHARTWRRCNPPQIRLPLQLDHTSKWEAMQSISPGMGSVANHHERRLNRPAANGERLEQLAVVVGLEGKIQKRKTTSSHHRRPHGLCPMALSDGGEGRSTEEAPVEDIEAPAVPSVWTAGALPQMRRNA